MNSESHDTIDGQGQTGPAVPPLTAAAFARHELHHVRNYWCWFFSLGVLLVLGGILAIASPAIAAVAAIRVLSIVLLVAGVATIVGSFWTGKWGGFLVHMLVGLLYLAASFVIADDPLITVVLITAYIAVTFMVMGLFRILAAMTIRYPQWGWSLLNGCITLLLGLVILRDFKLGAWWIIGLLVGIELLFSGLSWVMLSLALRRIPDEATA